MLSGVANRVPAMRRYLAFRQRQKEIREWRYAGRPVPPPHVVKQKAILQYARRYGLRTLVETGTFYGDMIAAMHTHFERVVSIELSAELYQRAVPRFKKLQKVELIHGDSGEEIKRVVEQLSEPALFWLDGHYSGGVTAQGAKDTPILEELDHILRDDISGHVILIDDARCFGSDPAYPDLSELKAWIQSRCASCQVNVQDDCIRVVCNTA